MRISRIHFWNSAKRHCRIAEGGVDESFALTRMLSFCPLVLLFAAASGGRATLPVDVDTTKAVVSSKVVRPANPTHHSIFWE